MGRNRKQRAGAADEGAPTVGEWIVTFSDCMTLLLCFFVLLLTFSSFEEIELQKLAGAFDYMSLNSIFPIKREIKDSVVRPVPRQIDQVTWGAEMPQEAKYEGIEVPKDVPQILAIDAYRDRRVFYIRSADFFHGNGASLTPGARSYLRMIAQFVNKVRCRVVVAESTPRTGLARSRAAVVYLTGPAVGLPAESCYSSAPHPEVEQEFGEPMVEVSLLAWKVY